MSVSIATNYREIAEQLPPGATITLPDVDWEEYESILDDFPEATSYRLSYDGETLEIMAVSAEHENIADVLKLLMGALSLRLRVKIRFFGSTTIKKRKEDKGLEPDACFYVQSVGLIGNRVHLDFEYDPPPDIAVEIDIHHRSLYKRPIYAALGIPELWRYNRREVTIFHLEDGVYVPADNSLALPFLTARVLTDFLARNRNEGELQALSSFDDWLTVQIENGDINL
jgi:Uma2 family endonuclease